MVIVHDIYKTSELSTDELRMLKRLKTLRIVSTVCVDGKIGVARWGTNRGLNSQLYKFVKRA